ncbi:MAG: biotin--[acetyl-CoA-carboxylase] ligase [Gammaproteobacteria bacterium]|nr:biotin--[acetyl-CoA-carboxylase] ligase [Gammaproteobacteria bacterium]
MPNREALIGLLADGQTHSGVELARQLACSRTAVWKQLHRLPELGLSTVAEPGRGYRLLTPLDLFDERKLRDALSQFVQRRLDVLQMHAITDSTNNELRRQASPEAGRFQVALAEFQTGGRGRRGRHWLSPFGSGVCLSISTTLAERPAGMPALGLALGVAVQRALTLAGVPGVQLKWPNDLLANGGKLAGLLTEVDGEPDGPLRVITGVGVNLRVPPDTQERLRQDGALPAIGALELAHEDICRNRLAAGLINELGAGIQDFAEQGFAPIAAEWRRLDALRDQRVEVRSGDRIITGVADGIDANGSLVVMTSRGRETVVSGEVSVRPL